MSWEQRTWWNILRWKPGRNPCCFSLGGVKVVVLEAQCSLSYFLFWIQPQEADFLLWVIQTNSTSGFCSISSLQAQMLYKAILFSPQGISLGNPPPAMTVTSLWKKKEGHTCKVHCFYEHSCYRLLSFLSRNEHGLESVNISIWYMLAMFLPSLPLNGNLTCSDPKVTL